jgi:Tfp pilus assembly protein PilN
MTDASFLPEDYLAKQAERRTNVISLTLFVVVMAAVFGAFMVTNRQANKIKSMQASINVQFQEAAAKIEQLNQLEEQKERMLNKAELATALVERVPRSILLAELINRMPSQLSLQHFELKSTAIKPPPPKATESAGRLSARRNSKDAPQPDRPKTREESMEERAIEAPRYAVQIVMVGVAPTDPDVARYIAALNAYPLLQDVTLKYSIQTEVRGQRMQEFRVEMMLDPAADIRTVEPLIVPRGINNPMSDELRFTVPGGVEPSADPTTGPATEPSSDPDSGEEN